LTPRWRLRRKASAALRKQLEKQRDSRYIEPAQVMLGLKHQQGTAELPSIL
jgi:hypothetical protein